MSLLIVSGASLMVLVIAHGFTFLIGRRLGRYNVVDVTWGVGFVAVAAVCAAMGTGDVFRRILLLVLVGVWGLRLAWHMVGKSAGKGEDPRYRALLGENTSAANVIRRVFVVQAAAGWFISLPLQVSSVLGPTPPALLPVLVVGVALWLLGLVFEAVGDHQLRRFKADPAHRGAIMDSGLWAWTRHPNYFGDCCVWWGLWLITVAGWVSLVTVVSPALMTYFLVYATGARLTEKQMADRSGFSEYCSCTSFFIPRPPKSRLT
ncbi:MAG: DUF1295 domain-containing protein [Mycobacterium sp.]